jgi:hypothetical protein
MKEINTFECNPNNYIMKSIPHFYDNINDLINNSNKDLEEILELITKEARMIDIENIHSRLYEVCNYSPDIKDKIIYSHKNIIDKNKVLKRIIDSRNCPKNCNHYIAIEKNSVTGDVYQKKKAIVSIDENLFNKKDFLRDVYYSTKYDFGRYPPFIKNRGGFPIFNKISNDVEYILIVDNEKGINFKKEDISKIIFLTKFVEQKIYNQKIMTYLYGQYL